MSSIKNLKIAFFLILCSVLISSCGGAGAKRAAEREHDPKKRVQKNLQEGRGFTIMGSVKKVEVEFLNLQVLMSCGKHHLIQ